jgi:uncharacterized protein YfaQ (DUF2300 family)
MLTNQSKTFIFMILFMATNISAMDDIYLEKDNGKVTAYKIRSKTKQLIKFKPVSKIETPIGSLWKLLVYAYIKEEGLTHSPYTCNGQLNDETFCCEKGESINEDEALAKSCGLYFSPYRLKITKKKWQKFWKTKKINHDWLSNINSLKPEKVVSVEDLLNVLERVKEFPKAKNYLNEALINVILKGTAKKSSSQLGAFSRIKTFTWDNPNRKNEFVGGFAGWLVDGKLLWAMGKGRSSEFLERVSPALNKHWMKTSSPRSNQCVSVRYFHDYTIKTIKDLSTDRTAESGILNGTYSISFNSGRVIRLNSNDDLVLKREKDKWIIDGQMPLNYYIARVLDREVSSKYQSAAEAFSIVIRSYLFERAKKIGHCFHVIDSSKFQRVSANIPSKNSLSISSKTSGLVLNNAGNIRYHLKKDGKNLISWLKAKGLDLLGKNSKEILKHFYPNSSIVYKAQKYASSCGVIERANKWLSKNTLRWHKYLVSKSGYEKPTSFKVCKLNSGAPFTNKKSNEIFVRGFDGFENQYSIAHEYLHLAFKYHPIGNNEREIDRIAKKLVTMF